MAIIIRKSKDVQARMSQEKSQLKCKHCPRMFSHRKAQMLHQKSHQRRKRVFKSVKCTCGRSVRQNCLAKHKRSKIHAREESKILQNKTIINLYVRLFDKSHFIEYNPAEKQPRITTNSVFLYKDPSNYFVNRRSIERLFLIFFAAQGINFTGVLLYVYIAWFFSFIVRYNII